MADLNNLPDLTVSASAFRTLYANLLAQKSNGNPSLSAEDAAERAVSEWGDLIDGCIAVLQDDYQDRIANPVASAPIVDSFGWSGSSSGPYYIPFASKIVESGTMSTQHLYRCPVAGTLSSVALLCQNDPSASGSTDFAVYQADGSTSLYATTGLSSTPVSWGASSTAYEIAVSPDVGVTAGQYLSMEFDPGVQAGEVTGWLRIAPS